MKPINIIAFFLLLLGTTVAARGENAITLSSISGVPGEEVEVAVELNNSDAISALNLTIPLSKNLTYTDGSALLAPERISDHAIAASVNNSVLKIAVYSLSLNPITGNSGKLLTFKLKLGNNPETFEISANDIVASDATGTKLTVSSQAGTITCICAKSEYETYKIDYDRVPIRSTHTKTFNISNTGNAELVVTGVQFSDGTLKSSTQLPLTIAAGNTGRISIEYSPLARGDVNEEMTIVSNTTTVRNTIAITAKPFAVNELHVENASGNSDTEATVNLRVNNMDPLCGFQIDFKLPDQLKYVEGSFALSDRKANHLPMGKETDGVLRLMAYSIDNSTFAGEDGVIASFRVKLSGRYGCTLEAASNKLTSLLDGEPTDVASAKYSGYVDIKSPQISCNEQLGLGRQPVTAMQPMEYAITNSGSADLKIDRVVFDNEAFSIDGALPEAIHPWESATVKVKFATDQPGKYSATMQFYCNDPELRVRNVAVDGTLYSPNFLTLKADDAVKEREAKVNVLLSNHSTINGAQFDFRYPSESFDVTAADFAISDNIQDYTVSARGIGEGVMRVFVYSLTDTPIASGESEILTISLHPKTDIATNDYEVGIENLILSTTELSNIASSQEAMTGFALSQTGDVNKDGRIAINDAMLGVNYILGNKAQGINTSAIDANGDGRTAINDIMVIINKILSGNK